MGLYTILRKGYHLFPDGDLKRFLTGMVYRTLYGRFLLSYSYDKVKGLWRVVTRDGITLLSLKDFDPAPLMEEEIQSLSLGENVLDLGGNIGMVAIYMARKVGASGHVWVYEPDRKNQQLLQQHLEVNGVENVTLVPSGVWSEEGVLSFFEGGTYTSSFVKTNYIEESPSQYEMTQLPVVTLDGEYLLRGWRRLDFVKMDIEGSEYEALKGAKRMLMELSPRLLIETHETNGEVTAGAVRAFLESLGYEVKEKSHKDFPTLYAWKNESRRQQ